MKNVCKRVQQFGQISIDQLGSMFLHVQNQIEYQVQTLNFSFISSQNYVNHLHFNHTFVTIYLFFCINLKKKTH